MLFTKTSSAVEWKAVASAIKTLVEEATFEASSESLIFRAMDPSHIALVDLMWPAVAFEKYECDKPFKFSIRVEDFVKLIGRTDSKDSIELTSTEEDALLLRLMNGYKREFRIHLDREHFRHRTTSEARVRRQHLDEQERLREGAR